MEAAEHEIKIECPYCGQHIIIDKPPKDIRLECPSCLKVFIVFATKQSSSRIEKPVKQAWQRIKTKTRIAARFFVTLTKKSFLRLPEWARGSIVTAAVFIFVILVFFGKDNQYCSMENHDLLTSNSMTMPSGDKTEAAKSTRPLVKTTTLRERVAMGRVWYSYTYVSETLKKRMANSANNSGEIMFVNGLGGIAQASLLAKIRTSGCPDDFVDAWKSYVKAEGIVLAMEGPLFMAETAIKNAQRQGQYVDAKTRNDAKELKSNVEKAKRESEQRQAFFFSICERYGGVSALTEWAMQFRDGLADASDDEIFDEMFKFEN